MNVIHTDFADALGKEDEEEKQKKHQQRPSNNIECLKNTFAEHDEVVSQDAEYILLRRDGKVYRLRKSDALFAKKRAEKVTAPPPTHPLYLWSFEPHPDAIPSESGVHGTFVVYTGVMTTDDIGPTAEKWIKHSSGGGAAEDDTIYRPGVMGKREVLVPDDLYKKTIRPYDPEKEIDNAEKERRELAEQKKEVARKDVNAREKALAAAGKRPISQGSAARTLSDYVAERVSLANAITTRRRCAKLVEHMAEVQEKCKLQMKQDHEEHPEYLDEWRGEMEKKMEELEHLPSIEEVADVYDNVHVEEWDEEPFNIRAFMEKKMKALHTMSAKQRMEYEKAMLERVNEDIRKRDAVAELAAAATAAAAQNKEEKEKTTATTSSSSSSSSASSSQEEEAGERAGN